MNSGQEKFLEFILDNVIEGKEDEAKKLLSESFKKQDDGSFNKMYLITFIPKMLKLIKPESVEKVKEIMTQFKNK